MWRVHDLHNFEHFIPRVEDVSSVVGGNGRLTSTLRMTAGYSSVVQCVEHNQTAVRRIEINSFSKYALLRVLESDGGKTTTLYVSTLISGL